MTREASNARTILDLTDIDPDLSGDPLTVGRKIQRKHLEGEKGEHERKRIHIATSTGLALYYASNREEYKLFLEYIRDKPYGKGLKPDADLCEICNAVAKHTSSATSKEDVDRAYKYSKIMERYIRMGVEAHMIPGMIEEEGGIQAAINRASREFPRRARDKSDDSDQGVGPDDADGDQDGTESSPSDRTSGTEARSSENSQSTHLEQAVPDYRRDNPSLVPTEILLSQRDFSELRWAHENNEELTIRLVPKPSMSDWFHFRGLDPEVNNDLDDPDED